MPAHSRIDRWYGYTDVTVVDALGDPVIPSSVSVALLAPGATPTSATVWTAATLSGGQVEKLFAGPDADPAGAVVVPAEGGDYWLIVDDDPERTAKYVTSFTIT